MPDYEKLYNLEIQKKRNKKINKLKKLKIKQRKITLSKLKMFIKKL